MKNTDQRLTRKDLWHVYRGQFFIRSCLNFERMQNIGFTHAMSPIIEKYYDTPEEKQEAIDRHMQMFLTQPMVASIPIGVSAAMEERLVVDKDIEPESIDSTKTALMGPLAALGDSLINGTARPILAGIACSLALTGNLFAPFLFLLLFNIPNVLVRYFGCHWGYNSGMKALNRFEELGLTEKIFTAASIIGLLVIGGMSASMVSINPVIAIGSGDSAIKLIDVINGIMPKMLSLFTTLGVYRLLKKGTKPNTILLGIIVVSVLLTAIGVF